MKFLNPGWLTACVLIPIVYLIVALTEKRRMGKFKQFALETVWKRIAPQLDPKARLRKMRIWLFALLFTFLALARPQWGTHEETTQASGLDVMVALDLSNSMEVEDSVPSRLEKAKHLIRSLVDQLSGDRMGLIGFAGSAFPACPLTNDLAYVLQTVQTLSPKSIQTQGTDIGAGLEVALKALDRAAQDQPSRVIVLISDGEDHENTTAEMAKKIKESGVKLYILGVGTQKGGPIPVKDEYGNRVGFKKDAQGQPIVSEFHPDELTQLAAQAGGKYWSTTPNEAEIKELVSDLGGLHRSDYTEHRYLIYDDWFQIPLAVAIFLFFIELFIPAKKMIKVLPLLLLLFAASAHAAPANSLDSYLENEEGLKAFKEGKIEDAQKRFGEAQARDPGKPELDFNQGVTQLQQGNADAAILSFENAAREAKAQGNSQVYSESMYNLGAAFTKKGDLKPASKAYLSSIEGAHQLKDSELEAHARKNLELLQQAKQKQKNQKQDQKKDQKQKQDQQQQKQDQKQGQDQNQKKDQKQDEKQKQDQDQDKDSEQKKNQDKRYQDPSQSRRQFDSKKLTAQDAESVIDKLRERERQLQTQLRKKHGNPQITDKDW